MKRAKFSMVIAALAVVGMAALLYGCGEGGAGAQDASAKQQFLAERANGGTPAPVTGTVTSADGGKNTPGVFGTVEKVEGDKLTVKSPLDGSTSVVQLAEGAKLSKQVDAALSDLKAGERVIATGTKEGDVLQARMVQIGSDEASIPFRAGPGIVGGPRTSGEVNVPVLGRGYQPGTTPGTVAFDVVRGTVEKVDGKELTVKTEEGVATVAIGDDTTLRKQQEVKLSDVKVGDNIAATGSQKGEFFEATQVQIMDGLVVRKKP